MSKEKLLIIFLIIFAVIIFIIVGYFFISSGEKSLSLQSPNGAEQWEIGQQYKVEWASENIDKVGIVLFNDEGIEWIGENINASLGEYEWDIYPGHEYGYGFWVAVFEYPWREGNYVVYSDGAFSITFPELAGCDSLSLSNEWPYLASDFPDIRKVFITKNAYNGNLDGLVGADQKCQQEAKEIGYSGNWIALLGGDSDEVTLLARLINSERGLRGSLVEAKSSASLIRGATCHRLLGSSIDKFLEKFTDPLIVNNDKIEESFLREMQNVWLGRIFNGTVRSCIITNENTFNISESYSITTTCQNWTRSEQFVENYKSLATFPTCYTPSGTLTNAVALEGLSTGLVNGNINTNVGTYCSNRKKLICIED